MRPIPIVFGIVPVVVWVSLQPQAQTSDAGRKAYEARCVGCHGADGTGGGHGPGIVDIRRPRAASKEALRDLIRRGIPEAGMPPMAIPDAELDAIVAYVDLLKMPAADNPAPGDAAAGERFFTGQGQCSTCHMVRGRGGLLGPDLTNLARERKTPQIELALREPGARPSGGRNALSPMYKVISVRLRDGRALRGFAKYESPFDIGLVSLDPPLKFHSIQRSDVLKLAEEPSLMPRVEASSADMQNLLAYLTRLSADRSPGATLAGSGPVGGGIAFSEIARPRAGEWPTYHGQLSGNRHSPLDQINTANVARLSPRWTFPIPAGQRALQVTPVVVDGLMYVTAVNAVWALDARTGRQVWHYGTAANAGPGRRPGGRNQSRRRRAGRSRLPADRPRAPDRAAPPHGPTAVGRRDGRLPRALRRDGRSARRQRPRDCRRLGRRRGRPRIPGRVSGRDRRTRLALLDRSGARRAWLRNVGRQGPRARLRGHVADRHLRSRSAPALLADRKSVSRLQRRRAQGRQPLLELYPGARPRQRER